MGNTILEAGSEVVAVALLGDVLHLLPSSTANARQKFAVRVDDTDFKHCVAYKYAMQKKREAALREWAARRGNTSTTRPAPRPAATSENKPAAVTASLPPTAPERGSLFEDIPPPMDFGHGKFCVCGECREKRAQAAGKQN